MTANGLTGVIDDLRVYNRDIDGYRDSTLSWQMEFTRSCH